MRIFVRDKNFYKMLVSLAVPISLQQMITVGVNMMDNVMIGQLDEIAMSGVTLANNFTGIYQICCMGAGMGAGVLTSRFWGMGDVKSVKKTVNIMYRLTLILALLFSFATLILPQGIMRMYTPEEDVIAIGAEYLLVSVPCYLLMGFSLTTCLTLRSVGRANVPLLASAVSFFINIFFNWLFIFGNLGAPRLEATGAALGTLIARVCEFSITMGFFFFADNELKMRLPDLKMPCGDLVSEYARTSFPVLVSDTLLGVGNSAVSVVMGHIGKSFVAANSITAMTQQLCTVVIQGVCQASCTITGITLGEGNVDKAKKQGVTFAALGFIIGAIGCALILLLKAPIIGLYNITEETGVLAGELMSAVGFVVIFQSMNSILTKGVLRGGGDTKFLMVADILFLWCASIPLGAVAGLILKLPAFWIYVFLKIDQFIKAVWCLFRLKSGKWIKKIDAKT